MSRYFGFKPYEGEEKYGFISYKSEEYELVAPYAKELNDRGIDLWYDEGIPLGKQWDEVISAHIAMSSFMFVFVTNKIFISTEIKKEIRAAKEKNIPVIPIFLEHIENAPMTQLVFAQELHDMQGISAYEERYSVETVADELCRKLAELGIVSKEEQEAQERRLREKEEEQARMEARKNELSERERALHEQEEAIKAQLESVSNYKIVVDDYYIGKPLDVKKEDGAEKRFVIMEFMDKTKTDIFIPSEINGLPVALVSSAFKGFNTLVSLTISKGVEFFLKDNIKSITLLDGITSIGEWAFKGCKSLQSIAIPNSVTSIGSRAFENCKSLESVNIKGNINELDILIFHRCYSLKHINLSKGVTSIDRNIFKDLIALQSITIPDSVTSIGESAFENCKSLQSITIPDSVTSIGSGAFENCKSLQSITIPNSVTSIGEWAFEGCESLQSITIPDSVTSIDSRAFYGCKSLSSIKLSPDNKDFKVVDGVLFNKDITTLICYPAAKKNGHYDIPKSVTNIEAVAFCGCKHLKSINIPTEVTSIGGGAFKDCEALTSITIPEKITSISNAFTGCKSLKSIKINRNNESFVMKDKVLFDRDMKTLVWYPITKKDRSYTIPDTVTSIGAYAFGGCKYIKSITIPSSVTEIDWYAFSDCKSLVSVNIPGSVTEIGWYAFSDCKSLVSVNIPGSVTKIGLGAFKGCTTLKSITVSEENKKYFVQDNVLFDEYNIICYPANNTAYEYTIPKEFNWINPSAFSGCKFLRSVIISSYLCISPNAFENCMALEKVVIKDDGPRIGEEGFVNCPKLTIYGCGNSDAEAYAQGHNIPFVEIAKQKKWWD